MIVKCLIPVIMSLMFLMSCNIIEEAIGIDKNEDDDKDKIVRPVEFFIDTTVSVSAQSAVITGNDGFSLIIPQGLTVSPFRVQVNRPWEVDSSDGIKILNCYDVNLSFGNTFNPPLTITIPFDMSKVENIDSLKAAYYDEVSRTWVPFDSRVVQNGSFTFTTNHLTRLGVLEIITSGGYTYKFTGAKGVEVYYTLSGKHAVMSPSDYGEVSDQPYHIPTSDPLWAPVYVQDIAFTIKEVREILAASPDSLKAPKPDETVTVYVKYMEGSDGQYGTVSGSIYINNSVTLPSNMSGITKRQILRSTAAHEYLHFIQDYYYVMNNASIGQWWLEALATQADRLVWGDKLVYCESEIYSIESFATLIENLSKSWDDCNADPNWYLAGCFFNYLSKHRNGSKLNIASILKVGGSSNSIYRIVLDEQIKSQLSSDIGKEYADYVRYLFEKGNQNLTVLTGGVAHLEMNPSFNETIERNGQSKTEEKSITVPYLAVKMITLKNGGTDTLKTEIKKRFSLDKEIYLCEYDKPNDKFTGFVPITNTGVISTLAKKNDKNYILIINKSTSGNATVNLVMSNVEEVEDVKIDAFQYMQFTLLSSGDAFSYSDGKKDNIFEVGFLSDQSTRSIESEFKNDGTFSIISEKVFGAVVPGGFDEEGSSYDSCRLTVQGKYKGNVLYDVSIKQNKQTITPNGARVKNSNGDDILVNAVLIETRSLLIDMIVLDQDFSYYAFGKQWSGDDIQSHVIDLEHSIEKYAQYDNKLETITKTEINNVDWGLMSSMTMYLGKK